MDILRAILKKIPINITKNQRYDKQAKVIIRKTLSINSNCIDIGAHKGEFLKLFLKYAPKGNHVAFEPIPHLYTKLNKQFSSNCSILNIALSDVKSKSNFHFVPSHPAYSGLKRRKYPNKDEITTIIDINTDLLDNSLPPEEKIDFIKIDVEGAEFQVLKGALKTIKKYKPIIIFEYGKGAADYYNTKPTDIYNLLTKDCKLNVSLMKHWIKNKEGLSLNAFTEQFEKELNYYFIAHP